MEILLLTQVLPYPPDSGPKVKTYNVIKYLTQEHEVTLVSFVRGDKKNAVSHLQQYCCAVYTVPMRRSKLRDAWYMGCSLLTAQPFMMIRDDRIPMRRLVKRLTGEKHFDAVHADQLNMAQYAEGVSGAFRVLDAHNALWLLYKRQWETTHGGPYKWLLNREWKLLRHYEGRICREFDVVLAVSEEDKKALLDVVGQPRDIIVMPIAIAPEDVQLVERIPDSPHILHIGTMFWPPNVAGVRWFIDQVLPLVKMQRPDVVFDVVGSRPPRDLVALGKARSDLNVTGYVDDPLPYLRRAALMVVPLWAGGGMRVKILNAMAQGIPIVSTTLGYEGIEVTPGQDILVGDTPEAFAAEVLRVLNDPGLGRELATNGRKLIEEKYDYRNACCTLSDVYRRAVSKQNVRI